MLIKRNTYKTGIVFFLLVFLIGLQGCVLSKKDTVLVPGEKNRHKKDHYCELKTFSAKCVNNKVYLNWIVNTNITNYYFILEKSLDGKTFSAIQITKGFQSPVKEGLLYSYIDTNATSKQGIYRLRAVEAIKSGEKLLLYVDDKNLFKEYSNALVAINNNVASIAENQSMIGNKKTVK